MAGGDTVSTPTSDPPRNKRAATSDVGETDPSESPEPSRKKAKRSSSVEDADARLAAQLQAQENSLARSRTTRGKDSKPKPGRKQKKSAPRKKSAKKVGADDDSDVDTNGEAPPKRKAGGGFQKPFVLSDTLSVICGETQVRKAS